MKYRLAALVGATFLAGVLLYGVLALIRDFMSILTTIAIVLVAAAIALTLLKVATHYLKRWWRVSWSTQSSSITSDDP